MKKMLIFTLLIIAASVQAESMRDNLQRKIINKLTERNLDRAARLLDQPCNSATDVIAENLIAAESNDSYKVLKEMGLLMALVKLTGPEYYIRARHAMIKGEKDIFLLYYARTEAYVCDSSVTLREMLQ